MTIAKNPNHNEAAQERLKSDQRQLGGLLLVLGTAAMVRPCNFSVLPRTGWHAALLALQEY
jgi:hypothetical protein